MKEKLAMILRMLEQYFDGDRDKVNLWMSSPNPLLGGVSPGAMVMMGGIDKLLKFMEKCHYEDVLTPEDEKLIAKMKRRLVAA